MARSSARDLSRRRSRWQRSRNAAGCTEPPHAPVAVSSARSLAAALWRLQLGTGLEPECSSTQSNIFSKLESCAKLPNTDMERIAKWDYFQVNSKNKVSSFHKDRPKDLITNRESEKIYRKIDSMKQNLSLERENRQRVQTVNSELVNELTEAKSTLKKYLKRYKMERRAREVMEGMCEDLAKEVEIDKANVEALKLEAIKIRDELEEERRMLQMAEVWREERVQMKLVDAKLALESKYSELNDLKSRLEVFLSVHSSENAGMAVVRQAGRQLRREISGREIEPFYHEREIEPVKGFVNGSGLETVTQVRDQGSCDSSEGSVNFPYINGVKKENYFEKCSDGEISEDCSGATKLSRNKGSSSRVRVSGYSGNNENNGKMRVGMQKKKRRTSNRSKAKKCNGGLIGGVLV